MVNSFDLFDTVVGRRFKTSSAIFTFMETLTNIRGFANIREQAQLSVIQRCYPGDYFLTDVYAEIASKYNAPNDELEYLMQLELQLECDNLFLVQSIYSVIKDGDIIVTDTYYTHEQIHAFLQAVGFEKNIRIYAHGFGKYDGFVWDKIAADGIQINLHTGDNKHSDVDVPLKYGVNTELFSYCEYSKIEQRLVEYCLPNLANYVRELRLTTFSKNRKAELIQVMYNIPLLVLISVFLKDTADKNQIDRYLFSSRDTFYLKTIFDTLYPQEDTVYFKTSRIAKLQSSDKYIDYYNAISTDNTLIVDMGGTGWSLINFLQKVTKTPRIFYVQKYKLPQYMEHISKGVDEGIYNNVLHLNDLQMGEIICMELLNYTNEQMVLGIGHDGEFEYLDIEEDVAITDYKTLCNATVMHAANLLQRHSGILHEIVQNKACIVDLYCTLYADLTFMEFITKTLYEHHCKEEVEVMHYIDNIVKCA